MAIQISDNIASASRTANLDAKFGPYTSRQDVIDHLVADGSDIQAVNGLTVGVYDEDDNVVEYVFKNVPDNPTASNVTVNNLFLKQVAVQEETDPTVPAWAKQQTKPSYTASEVGAIPDGDKGVANGVATLGSDGKVPQSQLPSYVDDVLEYSNRSSFPATGESGKIYVALDTNNTYRWSGSAYVEISQSLALGETSSTAFAGDRGKAIEDKIPSNASSSNKLVAASDLNGKVDKVANATPNNFASFDSNGGIQDSNCNEGTFIKGVQKNGTDLTPDANGKVNVTVQDGEDGKSAYDLYVDSLPAGATPLSQEAWLASLKANIGEFKFVANVPEVETAFEDATSGGIGAKYTQSIDNISAGQDTLSVILLMNTAIATPAKTYMIATQEAATAGAYEFIYAGDLQSAMPSNVLTKDDIDNGFAGGGNKAAGAQEVKELNERVVDVEDKFTHTEYSWETFPNSTITNTTRNIRDNGTWTGTNQIAAELINVSPGDRIRIIVDKTLATPTTGFYAVLADETVEAISYSQDVKFADGYTSRVYSNDNVEFVIPSNGHILYHAKESSFGTNNSIVEKANPEIVNGIDKDVEEIQESVADIPLIKIDIYGGKNETSKTEIDITWSNMPKQTGHLQTTRWYYGNRSARYEINSDYNYIHVIGGESTCIIFFTKQLMPNQTVNESGLGTYFATGKRSNSVYYVSAGEDIYIKIPENSAYVYINKVGSENASTSIPQYFAFVNVYVGFDTIKRVEKLEEKVSNAKSFQDSYFDSNVLPYDITKSVGNTLIPINIEVDANGHVLPQSIQERNIQQKAKQFCLTQWTCRGNIPYRGDTSNPDSPGSESGGTFSEGTTITGMPYSSVKEINKYIGFDVSVLTFMTAVNNPYSLLYTENISKDNSKSDWGFVYNGVNCATYYGTVCSEFSSYATGMSIIISTHGHKWLAEYAMKAVCLYNQTEDNLKIGDILVRYKRSTMSSMHCMVVVDIIRNANGHVTSFKVAESTGSHVRFSTRTKIADSNTTNIVIAYRFIELYKNIGYDDSASQFIDLSLLPNPTYSPSDNAALIASAQKTYSYNNDICTFAGDKACFAEGDLVVLNYNLNNDANFPYTDIEVYKDDVLIGTYNIASIDQSELPATQQGHALKLGTTLLPGDYKARCKNSSIESEYTYFEVIDTSHVTIENDFTNNRTTINFSSTNGLPVCVGIVNISGGQLVTRELTDGEVLSGEIKSDFIRLYKEQNNGKTLDDSVELWIKLYFKGKYGRVTAKLPYMNV